MNLKRLPKGVFVFFIVIKNKTGTIYALSSLQELWLQIKR
jgi:hypothetical protein